jgi:hypothetical protein
MEGLEGLEVLMMYGYKIRPIDIRNFCSEISGPVRINDTPPYRLKELKFCLATAGSKKLATVNFEKCLHDATSWHTYTAPSFVGAGAHGVELARVLLMAGLVNPNPSSPPPPGSKKWTPLWHAIEARHTRMIKLLIEFGADISAVVPTPHQNLPQPQSIQESSVWWSAKKTEILLELGDHHEPVVVNGPECIHQLCLEITLPLRLLISEILVVAFMRATDQTPPVGVISSTILSFCKFLDFDQCSTSCWSAA